MQIRYMGALGAVAQNEAGRWESGQIKEVDDNYAAALIASGCFEEVSDDALADVVIPPFQPGPSLAPK